MLPLVFAAFVWPARRVWAIRSVELLVALILSKVAIVAVLSLGAGALSHGTESSSIVSLLAGVALVVLGLFAPWALVKLMPLGELAAAAAGPLRGHFTGALQTGGSIAGPWAEAGEGWAGSLVSGMRNMAESARQPDLGPDPGSREPDSPTNGVQGVDGGNDGDPLLGTANRPGGQGGGGAGEPGTLGAGTPGAPGAPASPGAPETPGPAGPSAPAAPAPPSTPPPPAPPPPSPAADSPDHQQNSRAERGPSKDFFQGFPGAEDLWQGEDETWAPDQLWKVFDEDDPQP
jgi:hypothetical protein